MASRFLQSHSNYTYRQDFSTSVFQRRRFVNSTIFSRSSEQSVLLVFGLQEETEDINDSYLDEFLVERSRTGQVIPWTDRGHSGTVDRLKLAITRLCDDHNDITVASDSNIQFTYSYRTVSTYFVSPQARPDVFINLRHPVVSFLLCEVHSSSGSRDVFSEDDCRSSLRKLGVYLAETLRSFRQRNPSHTSLSGYYFPTGLFENKAVQ